MKKTLIFLLVIAILATAAYYYNNKQELPIDTGIVYTGSTVDILEIETLDSEPTNNGIFASWDALSKDVDGLELINDQPYEEYDPGLNPYDGGDSTILGYYTHMNYKGIEVRRVSTNLVLGLYFLLNGGGRLCGNEMPGPGCIYDRQEEIVNIQNDIALYGSGLHIGKFVFADHQADALKVKVDVYNNGVKSTYYPNLPQTDALISSDYSMEKELALIDEINNGTYRSAESQKEIETFRELVNTIES